VPSKILIPLALSMLVASARSSSAQSVVVRSEPDSAKARVHVGRLMLNPTIMLTNLGIDTNVFNQSDQGDPQSDFTMTVTPQTDLWLRMGRSWLTGNVREDLVWYKTFASERSANHTVGIGWLVPLNRVTFDADTSYLRTRARPGFEIDLRSERTELASHGSVEFRARPKIYVGFRGERMTTRFDADASFVGYNLREQLNRTTTTGTLTVRHQLTPLTGLIVDVGREQQRFAFEPLRDSDSTTAAVRVKLDRFALIKGSASLGYRDLQPTSSSMPSYTGATADADLSYVAFGNTQLGMTATRDVEYSFDIDAPYYLLTGVTVSVARRLVRQMDVVGRFGIQKLAYRDRIGPATVAPDRSDDVRSFGGGIGYHMANGTRIGFNVDRQRRASPVAFRQYHGLTFGTSVTYGL
jgi:Putative beta-barrel porin 2